MVSFAGRSKALIRGKVKWSRSQQEPGGALLGYFHPTFDFYLDSPVCTVLRDKILQRAAAWTTVVSVSVTRYRSRETPDAAAGKRQVYRYRVTGFGCHTEYRVVEFLEELFATRFCSWCGLVASQMYILSCLHIICPRCQEKAFESMSGFTACLIDKEILYLGMIGIIPNNVHLKRVRCPSQGCDYTGHLKDLSDHMGESCGFHLTTCTKCDASIAHKDMRSHFWTCEGAPGVFLQDADVQSLLEDLDNARKELGSVAVCSASANLLENAVAAVTELFSRLKSHLGMETPGTPGPDGAVGADPVN
ncbi:hypothetical protein HPB49_001706 [Dermacentor silvarum]|uniref:Uncharacterized protein n=1 Tax=Dermacentor silvarum TaxID=543639 RepID=A0ACB8DI03_DERSI|nr:hypothetical protein HPB49_001706 [Dermacentor silvarum]